MKQDPVATVYARALLEIGEERGETASYEEELKVLGKEVLSEGLLKVFFESPKISLQRKKEVLSRGLEGKVSPAVLNLLKILLDRGRQPLLDEIVESYMDLYDQLQGRIHVKIVTSQPVLEESWQRIVNLLKSKHNKEIIAEHRVDEDLLGGVTIQVGDIVADGSIRTQLNRIREALASQRLGSELVNED
ncbi:MAG: ATP synthase F1 subunit delta [Planctomycetota bacterium]